MNARDWCSQSRCFKGFFFSLRSPSSPLALALPEQLRQPRDVDGDAPPLVLGQHLGLQRFGFPFSGIDVRERLIVGVADDIPCWRARARGSGGMSWLPRTARERLPPHRRDRERRSLARSDPAGRGASASVREPVGRAPSVGHFQGDVFVKWSGLDWKPTKIVFEHPHCCPFESSRRPLFIGRDARQISTLGLFLLHATISRPAASRAG
jgi:hypothetical protein